MTSLSGEVILIIGNDSDGAQVMPVEENDEDNIV